MFSNEYIKNKFSLRKKSIGLVPVILGAVLVAGVSSVSADEVSNGSSPSTTVSNVSSDNSQAIDNLNKELANVNTESNSINKEITNIDTDIAKVNNDISSNTGSDAKISDVQNQINALNTQIDESNKANNARSELENSINTTKSEIAATESKIQEDEAKVNNPETITITKDPAGDAYREQQARIQSSGGSGKTALLGFSTDQVKEYNVTLTKEQADEYKRTGTIIYKPNIDKYADSSATIMKNIRVVNNIPLGVPPITPQANNFAQRRAAELSDTDFRFVHDSKRYPEEAERNRGTENIGELAPGLTKGMSGFNEMPFSDEELAYKNAYEYLSEYNNGEGVDFSHAYNLLDTTSIEGIGYGLVTKVKNGRLSIVNTFDAYASTPGKNLLSRDVYENQVKPVDDRIQEVRLPDGTTQLQYNGSPIKFIPHILFKYHYTGEPDPEAAKRLESERSKLADLKAKLTEAQSKVSSLATSSNTSELTKKRDELNKRLESLKVEKANSDTLSKRLASLNTDKTNKSKRLSELDNKKAEILKKLEELKKVSVTTPTNNVPPSSNTPNVTPVNKDMSNKDTINKVTDELNKVNKELESKNSTLNSLGNKINEINNSIRNRGIETESAKKDLDSKINTKTSELGSLKDELSRLKSSNATESKEVTRDIVGVSEELRDYRHNNGKNVTGKLAFANPNVEDITIKITPEQGRQLKEHGYFEPTFDDTEYASKLKYWMEEIRKANGINLSVPPITSEAMAIAKARTESMSRTSNFNHDRGNPKVRNENIALDRITAKDGIYKGANAFALSTDELAYADAFDYMSEYSNIEEGSEFGHAINLLTIHDSTGLGASVSKVNDGNKTSFYRSLEGTNLHDENDNSDAYWNDTDPVLKKIRTMKDSEGSSILSYNGKPIKFPKKRVYHYVWDQPVDNSSKLTELNTKISSVEGELSSLNDKKSKLSSSNVDDLKSELSKVTNEKETLTRGISELSSKRTELESKLATLKATPSPKEETPKVETPKVETPKVETPKPKVETAKPKVETPKVETTKPKVEESKPKVETAKPKVETPKVETTKPKVETTKVETPKVETAKPKVETAKPKVEESKPKVETAKPKVETSKPKVETAKPKVETSKPKVEESKPKVETSKPKVEESKPKVETSKPKVEESKPKVETVKPKVETSKPKVETTKPKVEENKPKVEPTTKPKVETTKPKVETIKPKVETTKHKVETVKPRVETTKPSIESPKVVDITHKENVTKNKEVAKVETTKATETIKKDTKVVAKGKKDDSYSKTTIKFVDKDGVSILSDVLVDGIKVGSSYDLSKEKPKNIVTNTGDVYELVDTPTNERGIQSVDGTTITYVYNKLGDVSNTTTKDVSTYNSSVSNNNDKASIDKGDSVNKLPNTGDTKSEPLELFGIVSLGLALSCGKLVKRRRGNNL